MVEQPKIDLTVKGPETAEVRHYEKFIGLKKEYVSEINQSNEISSLQDKIHPTQEKIAEELFKKIRDSFKDRPHLLKNMKYFDFFAIVPKFRSLGKLSIGFYTTLLNYFHLGRQTIERFKSFIESNKLEKFLQDIQPDISCSKVEEHVIRNAAKGDHKEARIGSEAHKMNILKKRILEEKETFFFIVHDEAHYAPLKNNLVDCFINDRQIFSAPNLILLQVSATPYSLVTQDSRVKPKNRLDMFR